MESAKSCVARADAGIRTFDEINATLAGDHPGRVHLVRFAREHRLGVRQRRVGRVELDRRTGRVDDHEEFAAASCLTSAV